MNKAKEKAEEVKEKVDQHVTMELTKTRQILWRFSKVEKHIEKRRTTFSELFFDLAVVFIFSLLASRLMGSMNHSVAQVTDAHMALIKDSTQMSNGIGFLYWFAHFAALWFTWYQFSNYTKYHWRDNIGNNVLVLGLIMSLVLQGAGIYFTNQFLVDYSLLISFISARIIFCAAQFVAINYSETTKLSKELMIKTKRQIFVTAFSIILILIYVICKETGVLADVHTVKKQFAWAAPYTITNPWKTAVFVSTIPLVHMLIRFAWKIFGSKRISEGSYRIVFHTKERHHLFIIIAIGELIVVTLTSSFINKNAPTVNYETILYLFMTPFIGMAIWYVYKTVFYKATPMANKKNYYLYLGTHVLLVLGILVFLGSIKSHMQADAYLKAGSMNLISSFLNETSRTYYSLGVVIGFALIVGSLTIYATFAKFDQARWGKVVKGLSPILIIKSIIVLGWLIAEIILFWLNIKVHFSSIMYSAFTIEAVFAIMLVWRSQKVIMSLFNTVEEFDEYSAKLDH